MEIKGSFIGKGTTIQGSLCFSEDIRIDGSVTGKLSGGTTGRVLVSEKGYVEGLVEAGKIEVRGVLVGNAVAEGVFVYAPGVVRGTLTGSSVFVEDGAKFFNYDD